MQSVSPHAHLNRIAAEGYAIASALLGLTSLALPQWWASPAFAASAVPIWANGILWCCSATIMLTYLTGRPLRSSTIVAALVMFAGPTTITGAAIVIETAQANEVSAIGSAIVWLFPASYTAWRRTWTILAELSDLNSTAREPTS